MVVFLFLSLHDRSKSAVLNVSTPIGRILFRNVPRIRETTNDDVKEGAARSRLLRNLE